jgi:hypothetical protein
MIVRPRLLAIASGSGNVEGDRFMLHANYTFDLLVDPVYVP